MTAASADAEAFTLLALALTVIIIRIYVRWTMVGPLEFQLDDYLMPLTGLVFAGETAAAYLVVAKFGGVTNSYMTSEQRAAVVPGSQEYINRVWGSKIQVLGWSLYAMILWLIKLCLAVSYSRLTTGLSQFTARVRIAYIIIGVSYTAIALTILLSCQPMHKFWQINPDPGNVCQPAISKVYVLIVVIPNVLTDIYLLSIPLPLLWKVNISLKRKISLMILFSGGTFVIVAGIIRAVVVLTSGPGGAVSGSKWAVRETFVSIMVSNLPIISPLIRTCAHKIGLGVLFSSIGRPSQSHPLSSKEHTSYSLRKRSHHTHPLSIPGDTAWGSDENILSSQENKDMEENRRGQPSRTEGITKEITVVQETIIQSEQMNNESPASGPSARNIWKDPSRRTNSVSDIKTSVTADASGWQ